MDYNTKNTNDAYNDALNRTDDPIKAEKRAEDRAEEARLKQQASAQQNVNDARQVVADNTATDWQNKGSDKANEAKLKTEAKGKEFSNDVKEWGDKVGDSLHDGVEKVKGFFHKDDRVQ